MIQRIQSLWLLLASLAALLTLKVSFYSGNKIVGGVKQFSKLTATSNFVLLLLSVAIAAISFVLIFLFKDRKTQKRLTLFTFFVSLTTTAFYFSLVKDYIEGNYDLTAIAVFAVPIFLFMAFRGIWKDEKLVKNADRLR